MTARKSWMFSITKHNGKGRPQKYLTLLRSAVLEACCSYTSNEGVINYGHLIVKPRRVWHDHLYNRFNISVTVLEPVLSNLKQRVVFDQISNFFCKHT